MPMNRILIVGPPGAGKSTLARALGARLDLPVIHLDQIFWQPGWQRPEWEAFRAHVREAAEGNRWVMDGNYFDTYDLRFPRADTVIHLDCTTPISLYRVLRRIVTGLGRIRKDGPAGCPEQIDLPFLWFTITFHRIRRPRTLAVIEQYRDRLRVITLPNSRAADRFLQDLSPTIE